MLSWMTVRTWASCIGTTLVLALPVAGGSRASAATSAAGTAALPEARPWNGASRALVAVAGDPWITPCEKSGFVTTPRYDETVAWLHRLCDAAPELEMVSIGRSPEGRDLWMVIASRVGFTPEALQKSGRATVLAQAGIHAGEIDGKDAGMMLLRDLTPGHRLAPLLDQVNLLFVPIFNVDGHERFSAFTRINQRGPAEGGWRTTSRNLNLNRDYMKLDAPETRAMVQTIVRWDPDLYVDLHVTDGGDAQYDITWGYNGAAGWSPAGSAWLESTLSPALRAALAAAGHTPGPFDWFLDDNDRTKGLVNATAQPRFSNAYGDARHLPAMLVENHSLKPYDQRVLGTYVLLETTLRTACKAVTLLRRAVAADRARRTPELVLDWKWPAEPGKRFMDYRGIASRLTPSPISGGLRVEWLGTPELQHLPVADQDQPAAKARRPAAYWIPPAWGEVADRLELHGIRVERQATAHDVDCELYRITSAKLDTVPFEGHVHVTPHVAIERRRRTFVAGSVRVPVDQPLGDLAMLLLEPESPDSFFQWGFFDEVLQPTEYVEAYIMEPMAERMLAASAELRAAFQSKLQKDPAFAASPRERLQWFYQQTPFYDSEARLYPVGRE